MSRYYFRRAMQVMPALALCACAVAGFAADSPSAQRAATAAPAAQPPPAPPTRSPSAAGAPPFTVLGAAGANAPVDRDGNFVIGPSYVTPRELEPVAGVAAGRVEQFTMESADSRFYPGVARVASGTLDPQNPRTLRVETRAQPGDLLDVNLMAAGPNSLAGAELQRVAA